MFCSTAKGNVIGYLHIRKETRERNYFQKDRKKYLQGFLIGSTIIPSTRHTAL